MGEADLAGVHRADGCGQLPLVRTHSERVPHVVRVHVTVDADPVVRSVEAIAVPKVRLVELGRQPGKSELQVVDLPAQADQLVGDLLAGRLVLEHACIIPKRCSEANALNKPYSGVTYAAGRPPSTRNVAPLT